MDALNFNSSPHTYANYNLYPNQVDFNFAQWKVMFVALHHLVLKSIISFITRCWRPPQWNWRQDLWFVSSYGCGKHIMQRFVPRSDYISELLIYHGVIMLVILHVHCKLAMNLHTSKIKLKCSSFFWWLWKMRFRLHFLVLSF